MRITRDDAFKILGVNEESNPDEIRSCYKKLALKWHPDKHGDSNVSKDEATLKFQEVSAAYKRLTTNMNDADDEIDDNEFMNIREMMELFARIFFHNGVRCPHHGMDCCDFDDDEYFYSDDEYYDYTDEESEDEFLDSIAQRLRNKYEQRKYKPKDRNQAQRHNITEEEALRNARELIEEEEQEKQREETKKAKRKKKKEKKKQKEKEKKETELEPEIKAEEIQRKKLNKENNNPAKNGKNTIADEKPTIQSQQQQNQNGGGKQDKNTTGKKSKGSETSKKNNKQDQGKRDNTKNKNYKNQDGDPDEDIIDTNSAFFARAASKAPSTNELNQNHKDSTSNHKKKKGGCSTHNQQQPSSSSSQNKSHHTHEENSNNNKEKVNSALSTSSSISSSSNNMTQQHQKNNKNDNTTQPGILKDTEPVPKKAPLTNGVHKPDDVILQSRQVAVKGNQLAQTNNYTGAVEMFTKAISLDPTDFRFFGNRSYCFDRLENYKKALSDSDAAIKLAPEWPKGYFRKGRALTGLKRFQEAEQVFQQVLKLDPVCEDAQFELSRVRVQILIDMGFTPSLSEQAVRTYSTVQQALEALLTGKISDEEGSDEVYFSEEEEEDEEENEIVKEEEEEGPPISPSYHTVKNTHRKTNTNKPKAPPQPKCTALWVGNVDPELVTEKQMSQLFSKCGKVSSVRILAQKYCAFVNYVDPSSAVVAMERLQGAGLGSQKLLLRFPNNPPPGSIMPEPLSVNTKQPTAPASTSQQPQAKTSPSVSESSNDSSKASGPVNGNECYFWRTTGCVFESQCRYRHVRGHKGVDLAKVQAKYGNKLSS